MPAGHHNSHGGEQVTHFDSKQIFAIPNILGYYRILLIPEFVWLYIGGQYGFALAVLCLSAVSDFLDGRAARALGQITPLGRVVDPLADKLTQLAVIGCLTWHRGDVIFIFILLIVKEAGAGLAGLVLLGHGGMPFDSRWYGKVSTAGLYLLCALLLWNVLPAAVETVLIWLQFGITAAALVLYSGEFARRLSAVRER